MAINTSTINLQSIIDTINGNQGIGRNQNTIANLTQSFNTQTPVSVAAAPTQDQIRANDAGLVQQAFRDLSNNQLANINRNVESAGSSGSALAALLAQDATAATAGQVAKIQGDHLLQGAQIAAQIEGIKQTAITNRSQISTQQQGQILDLIAALIQDQTTQRGQNFNLQASQNNARIAAATSRANSQRSADVANLASLRQLQASLDSNATSSSNNANDNAMSRANNAATNATNLAISQAKNAPNPGLAIYGSESKGNYGSRGFSGGDYTNFDAVPVNDPNAGRVVYSYPNSGGN